MKIDIKKLLNSRLIHDISIDYCPSGFGLENSDCRNYHCDECWRNAIQKEFGEEEE